MDIMVHPEDISTFVCWAPEFIRVPLNCGWVAAFGEEFFSDRLAFMWDALQGNALVEIVAFPGDLSRVWVVVR
jgi:hypothetical protein